MRHRSARAPVVLIILLLLSVPAMAKEKKLRGYITEVASPTSFMIEDYRVTFTDTTPIEPDSDKEAIQFHRGDLVVGMAVEIRGELESQHHVQARIIKVNTEDFGRRVKRTAYLHHNPSRITQTQNGWRGVLLVDGQRVVIEPETKLVFKPTSAEKALLKKRRNGESEDREDETSFQPLQSLDQIKAGMMAEYEGRRQVDGSIVAERVQFSRNALEKGEARLWRQLKIKVKPFQETQGKKPKTGELRVGKHKYKLHPNARLQKYVEDLGQSLVPDYIRQVREADEGKIHFRFFVIEEKRPNAFAYPNGIICVNTALLRIVENEAQLASVLGHEISHVTQEHTWRRLNAHKKKRYVLMGAKIAGAATGGQLGKAIYDIAHHIDAVLVNGYSRALENQADRLGLQLMLERGYDPREAPQFFKVLTQHEGDRPTNVFWSSHDSNTIRRSYLLTELRYNYASLDFAGLRRNEAGLKELVYRPESLTAGAASAAPSTASSETALSSARAGSPNKPALAANQRMGRVKVGMSKEEVFRIMGKEDHAWYTEEKHLKLLYYDTVIEIRQDKVHAISVLKRN